MYIPDTVVYVNNTYHFGAKICSDICPRTLSVPRSDSFPRSKLEITVSFEEQIISKNKYSSIFLSQMEAIAFIIPQIFFSQHAGLVYEQFTVKNVY